MKQFLIFWIALFSLTSQTYGQAGRKYYVETKNGVTRRYIESALGSDQFVPLAPNANIGLARGITPIAKPVNKIWSAVSGNLDYDKYGSLSWPDGFWFTDFFRQSTQPISKVLRQQQFIHPLSLTDSERADPAINAKTYIEPSGNDLEPYQDTHEFFKASVQQVLTAVNGRFDPRFATAGRISFNFEQTYGFHPQGYDFVPNTGNPNQNFDTQGVLQHFPDAETRTIVCECPALKGQTRTLRQIWDAGQFQNEINQRYVNRHVALMMWYKAKAPGAKVTNGDGVWLYYTGSPLYDDRFQFRDNLTDQANSFPEHWSTPANFDAVTVGGVTLAGNGKFFYQVVDYINNYTYCFYAILSESDYDQISNQQAGTQNYPYLWSKVRPDADRWDLNLPCWYDINQRYLASKGVPNLPLSYQGHYKYEGGVRRGRDGVVNKLINYPGFPDETAAPAWHQETIAVLTRMCAKAPGSGLVDWATERFVPYTKGDRDATDVAKINATINRPLHDRMGLRAGLSGLQRFREYFDPANNPVVIYKNFIRYPTLAGGNTGSQVESGGDNFYRRSYRDIATSTADGRTKANSTVRIITKNGAKWALIVATNWGAEPGQWTPLDLRFRPAEVSGLTSNVDVAGLNIIGYEPLIVEVCLEPAKLTTAVGSGTVTTPPSTTTPPASGSANFYGFTFTPIANSTRPSNNIVQRVTAGMIVERRLDYGGAITRVAEIQNGQAGPNMVNNHDLGRQFQIDFFIGTPGFTPPGFNPGGPGYIPGRPETAGRYNPITSGDWANNPSEVINYGYDPVTGIDYTMCRAKSFFLNNYTTGSTFEYWTKPVGDKLFRVWVKGVVDRTKDNGGNITAESLVRFDANEHEFPVGYTNPAYYNLSYYSGNGIVNRNLNNQSEWVASVPVTQYWLAMTNASGRGYGFIGPRISSATARIDPVELLNQSVSAQDGEFSNKSSYVANMTGLSINPVETIYAVFDVAVGSVSEIQSMALSNTLLQGLNNVPNYNFATGKRHDFYTQHSLLNYEGVGSELVVSHGKEQARLFSPNKPFPAASAPKLYLRIRNTTSRSTLRLTFRKSGQAEDVNAQRIDFSVPNDGTYYTRELDMSNVPGWNGTINYFVLKRNCENFIDGGCPENTPASGVWGIPYFGINNPGN